VSGEGFPLVTYLGLRYLRRPLLARGELRVDWDPADLSRNVWWPRKKGRALCVRVKGRTYTYAERGGKRSHELVRPGVGVRITRTPSGTWRGEADALDIGIALVLEGVYTRNLSLPGALVALPGRFLDRFNDL
jgi:hypothetical protein